MRRKPVIREELDSVDDFERVAEVYQARVFRFCLRLCGNPSRAEDLVQETFVKAYRYRHSFESGKKVRPWLFKIALNLVRESHRKTRPEVSLEAASASPSLSVKRKVTQSLTCNGHEERVTQRMVVRRAVEGLNEKMKAPVVLFYFEDCSVVEVAEVLDITVSAAKVRLMRARAVLAERLRAVRQEEERP